MKTIIAGSRIITNYIEILRTVELCGWKPTAIVAGGARGVDYLGKRYAMNEKLQYQEHPALWNVYGKSAGFIRNGEMAANAEALIAIWDGESCGTKHMIETAARCGLRIAVHLVFVCVKCNKRHSGECEEVEK